MPALGIFVLHFSVNNTDGDGFIETHSSFVLFRLLYICLDVNTCVVRTIIPMRENRRIYKDELNHSYLASTHMTSYLILPASFSIFGLVYPKSPTASCFDA